MPTSFFAFPAQLDGLAACVRYAAARSRPAMESCPQRRNPLLCVRISADNERMRSLCCSVIAGLGIALSACNNPMLLVDVEIDYLPMGTTQLLVVTTVNGQPGREQHLSPDQRRIAVHLPQGASGTVGLRVYGMDAGECILTQGSLEADVPTSFNRTEQHSIQMARPSDTKKCSFTMQDLGFPQPAPALTSIWGRDLNHVYVVGGGGNGAAVNIVRRCPADGSTCVALNLPPPGLYPKANQAVWGSANHIFVGDASGRTVHCETESADCALMVPDKLHTFDIRSIWGADEENVYVVGNSGLIQRCQASTNRCTWLTGGAILDAVWGSSSEYVYAVGVQTNIGFIARCRGSSQNCIPLQFVPGPGLKTVWGRDAEHVYVAGNGGTLLRCTAASDVCTSINSGTTANLSRIWGDSGDRFYVVGDNAILRCQVSNDSCVSLTLGLTKSFHAVWGSDANNVYAVGDGGSIVRCSADSNTCTPLTSGVTADLHGVFGTDANNIYVVGNSGTILRRRL